MGDVRGRKTPVRLMLSELTKSVYAVTKYSIRNVRDDGTATMIAHNKHDVTGDFWHIAESLGLVQDEKCRRAIAALDTILFPSDHHNDAEKAEMRRQLVNDLAEIMEKRGWAGDVAENVDVILETAEKVAKVLTATKDIAP